MATSIGNLALLVTNRENSIALYTQLIGLQVLTAIETAEVQEIIVGAADRLGLS